MKLNPVLSICMVLLLVLVGCNIDNSEYELFSGYYFLAGDYDEGTTPYLELSFEDNSFSLGEGLFLSYAECGTFEINDEKIIATAQNTTFTFNIKDSASVIMTNCGGYEPFKIYEGLEFIYHADQ